MHRACAHQMCFESGLWLQVLRGPAMDLYSIEKVPPSVFVSKKPSL